jgi:hypothetical protein
MKRYFHFTLIFLEELIVTKLAKKFPSVFTKTTKLLYPEPDTPFHIHSIPSTFILIVSFKILQLPSRFLS